MANRYIIKGATYNGDGTSSALATSNGGVGAWNDITYFEGVTPAYGTLPAGTNMFIRSKDAAGNDITLSYSVAKTLGAGAGVGTEFAPVNWVIDNGEVWPGVNGVVTYNITAQVTFSLRSHNNFICATDYNLVILSSYAYFNNGNFFVPGICYTKGLKVDCSAHIDNYGSWHDFNDNSVHVNFWLRSRRRWYHAIAVAQTKQVIFYSPKIELLDATVKVPVFEAGPYGGMTSVFGGEIFGVGATEGVAVFKTVGVSGSFESYGLKFPRVMTTSGPVVGGNAVAVMNGCDGTYGNIYTDQFCSYDSRADAYYPTLNATLETSAGNPWSYKMYPFNARLGFPGRIQISKGYTQAAAAKTVTLEILWPIAGGLGAATADKVWMVVQYVDSTTGEKVTQTTQNMLAAALTSSSAGWSNSSYGPSFFNKYKLSLTTGSAIAQDSEVMVSFFVSAKSATADDVLFICPDPTFS